MPVAGNCPSALRVFILGMFLSLLLISELLSELLSELSSITSYELNYLEEEL